MKERLKIFEKGKVVGLTSPSKFSTKICPTKAQLYSIVKQGMSII